MQKKEEEIMKTLFILLSGLFSISLLAQDVNITFAGVNKNKEYQVVIDGSSYYSANAVSTRSNKTKVINIPSLSLGSHELSVYRMGNNNNIYSNDNNPVRGRAVYSKSFQLREGYDMNITVRANGLVSFSEKPAEAQYSQDRTPMSSTAFNQLLINLQNKRYQSDRMSMIRSAFNNDENNFTISQVRQLLLLVNSENRRLELAKLSYHRLTDPSNFSYVYDVFNRQANKDALDDYVVSKGGSISNIQNNAAYGAAMSTANFNELLQRIYNQTYQENKIDEIKNAFNSTYNYFSTAQLKQLLAFVNSEPQRLTLAKLAYNRTADRANFNQLVDMFYTQANRDELNSFIVSNGGNANTASYKMPMSDASFTQIYNKARGHFFQKNTLNEIRTAFSNTSNDFTTDQIRQLLLLAKTEADKLALAKLAYPRAVDPINYSQLLDLFTIQSNRTELDIFIKAKQ
jgi:hypothetical protein